LVGAAPSLSGPSIRDIGRSVARYFTGQLPSPGRAWPSSFRGGLPVDPYIPMVPDVPLAQRAATGDSSTSALAPISPMFTLCSSRYCLANLACRYSLASPRAAPRPPPTAATGAARDQVNDRIPAKMLARGSALFRV